MEIEQVNERALTLVEQADVLQIDSQEGFEQAAALLKEYKVVIAQLKAYHAPMIDATKAALDKARERMKVDVDPLEKAEIKARGVVNAYAAEVERKRLAEVEKQRKEQERLAELERQKLAKQATKAETKGDTEKAEDLRAAAQDVCAGPAFAQTAAPVAKFDGGGGVSTVQELVVEVGDLRAFLTALLERCQNLPPFVEVKPGGLKAWVKANSLDRFPGLKISKTASVRVR